MHSAAFKSQGGTGRRSRRQDARRAGAAAWCAGTTLRVVCSVSVRQSVLHKKGLLTGKSEVNGLDAVERYRRIEMLGLRKAARVNFATPLVRHKPATWASAVAAVAA